MNGWRSARKRSLLIYAVCGFLVIFFAFQPSPDMRVWAMFFLGLAGGSMLSVSFEKIEKEAVPDGT